MPPKPIPPWRLPTQPKPKTHRGTRRSDKRAQILAVQDSRRIAKRIRQVVGNAKAEDLSESEASDGVVAAREHADDQPKSESEASVSVTVKCDGYEDEDEEGTCATQVASAVLSATHVAEAQHCAAHAAVSTTTPSVDVQWHVIASVLDEPNNAPPCNEASASASASSTSLPVQSAAASSSNMGSIITGQLRALDGMLPEDQERAIKYMEVFGEPLQ